MSGADGGKETFGDKEARVAGDVGEEGVGSKARFVAESQPSGPGFL